MTRMEFTSQRSENRGRRSASAKRDCRSIRLRLRQALATDCQPFGEQARQASIDDFFLGGGQIIFDSPLLNHRAVDMINAIGGAPVSIAGLAHAARVNEIFFAGIDPELVDPL